MKRIVLGVAAALALSTAVFAAGADPMEPRYGNTVVLTAPDGKVTKLMYNKDKPMDVVLPDGTKGKGAWEMKGNDLCITPAVGPQAGKQQCSPFQAHKVGDKWEITLPDGSKLKAELKAGR